MKSGILATTVKGAFKIYLVPTTRARTALTSVVEGWSDLVTEARQEHAARKQVDTLTKREAGSAVAASESTVPAAAPTEQASRPSGLIVPGAASESQAAKLIVPDGASETRKTGPRKADKAARPRGMTTQPARTTPRGAQTEGPEKLASPTLAEVGESSVEVGPNPPISPAHSTSGVIPHVSPEVRHKLAGDGPIRA
jgi:hypothetical protein